MNILKGGPVYYDVPVGIICLESFFPKPPGHLRNQTTFDFPTIHHLLKDIDIPKLLFNPNPDMLEPFIEAAQELERLGAKAITGSCGFMARFHDELTEAVSVPVLVSSLTQLPLLRIMHGKSARIGILTASAKALTPAHFAPFDLKRDDFPIMGMEGYPEFWETIIEYKRYDIDVDIMRDEICDAAEKLVKENDLDVLLLECTDLSAFAADVQKRVELPVYDIDSLIEYAAYSVQRKKFDF